VARALQAYFENEDGLKEALPAARSEDDRPPVISELDIRDRIGCGGMGAVYRAYQPELKRFVALKTVRSKYLTKEGIRLFQREAELLAKCRHPNIVPIFESHLKHEVPYFLMEYVDGIPLNEALRGRSWTEIALVFKEVVAGVSSAHGYGVVHGDLKPANILVDIRSKPHILDFGLARLARQADPSKIGGTRGFLAPEVLESKVAPSFASDVYALGVTLYVILTGVLPYKTEEDALAGSVRLPMEHDTGIPEPLQRICLKAMDRNLEDRYQTTELMLRDLERFCRAEPVLARPSAYLRELEGRVQNQLSEIQSWEQQGFINQREKDSLIKPYGTLLHGDSPWLSETRKILTGPLFFRTGAWLLLLSSLLWPIFYWDRLNQVSRLASTGIPTLLMATLGISYLVTGNRRNSLACLGSFALLLLVFQAVVLSEFQWLKFLQPVAWEAFGHDVVQSQARTRWLILSNSQIFVAALGVTVCIILLLRYLRAAFFASWLAMACVGLFSAILLLVGDKYLLEHKDVAQVALHYLVFSIGLYFLGYCLDTRSGAAMSKPFYFVAVAILLAAAIALARFGAEEWLEERWDYDSQMWNLWLMAYAVPLFLWAFLTERFGTEAQRAMTWVLYLLAPIFALVPLNLLFARKGIELFMLGETPFRIYELLHLFVCIGLVVGGKYLRLNSFLWTGFCASAVWIFRITHYHFMNQMDWPILIAIVGGCFIYGGIWCSLRQAADSRTKSRGFSKDRPIKRARRKPDLEGKIDQDHPPFRPEPNKPIPAGKGNAPAAGGDPVVVQCIKCKKRLKVAPRFFGKRVNCPNCQAPFLA
jgi:serine/threonine protein kinase